MSAILSVLKIEAEYPGHIFSKASRVVFPYWKLITSLVIQVFSFGTLFGHHGQTFNFFQIRGILQIEMHGFKHNMLV